MFKFNAFLRILLFSVILLLIANLVFTIISYYRIFGGDPEIHLIFGKNFLEGYPFQFNQGEYSGGITSPIYMILVSIFILISGSYASVLMKLSGFLSFAIIIYYLYKIYSKNNSLKESIIFTILVVSIPSFFFQASLGMENIIYAAILLIIIYEMHFKNNLNKLFFFPLPFILFFLRPESIIINLYLIITALRKKRFDLIKYLFFSGVALLVTFILMQQITGVSFLNAGEARSLLSRIQSIKLDVFGINLFFSLKPFYSLIYTLPFIILLFYKKLIDKEALIILLIFYLLPMLLHFLVILPNTHFTRYFLYSNIIFWAICFSKINFTNTNKFLIIILIGYIVSLSVLENYKRINIGKWMVDRTIHESSEKFKNDFSNLLIDKYNLDQMPIILGVDEVQIRLRLDNRFIIKSFDGIVDYKLSKHITKDYIDLIQYVKDSNINVIYSYPEYIRNSNYNEFSLTKLSEEFMHKNVLNYKNLCLLKKVIREPSPDDPEEHFSIIVKDC